MFYSVKNSSNGAKFDLIYIKWYNIFMEFFVKGDNSINNKKEEGMQ